MKDRMIAKLYRYVTLNRLVGLFVMLYIIVYFAIPYVTKFSSYSIHSLILFVGGSILVIALLRQPMYMKESFTGILYIFLAMVVMFIFSAFVMNAGDLEDGIKAYIASMAAFLFIYWGARFISMDVINWFFYIYLFASGLLAYAQVFGGATYYPSHHMGGGVSSVYGMGFANFSSHGAALVLMPLAVVIAWLSVAGNINLTTRRVALVAISFGTVALIFSLSRAAWLGLLVGSLIVFIALKNAHMPIRRFTLAMVVVLLSGTAAYLIAPEQHRMYMLAKIHINVPAKIHINVPAKIHINVPAKIHINVPAKIHINDDTHDFSARTRLVTMKAGLVTLAAKPVWGVGIGRFPEYYEAYLAKIDPDKRAMLTQRTRLGAHNAYLDIAVESGLIVFSFYVFLIGLVVVRGLRGGIPSVAFPFAVALSALMVWMLFHDALKDRLFWIMLGLVSAYLWREASVSRLVNSSVVT